MKKILLLAFLLSSNAFAFEVGINVQQHSGTFDAAGQAFAKELGVHSIRVGYKHGDHDFGVNWANDRGIGVLFFLGYSQGCNPATAAGRQCYADRSASLAKTYGSKVQYYEVWNEWNGGIGLGCTFDQAGSICQDAVAYTDLLCRTHKAIKLVVPTAIVVGGVTAGADTGFISKMLDAGAGNCMDMVSVHPYVHFPGKFTVPYTSTADVAVAKFVEAVTAVHDLVRLKTGKVMKVVVSEAGRLDDGTAASQLITSNYLTELYTRVPSFVEGIWWFDLRDSFEGKWGLLMSNNTKKSSFAAFKTVAAPGVVPPPVPTPPPLPSPVVKLLCARGVGVTLVVGGVQAVCN